MDYAELKPHLSELRAELDQAWKEKIEADKHVENLENTIQGLEGLKRNPPPSTRRPRDRLQETP